MTWIASPSDLDVATCDRGSSDLEGTRELSCPAGRASDVAYIVDVDVDGYRPVIDTWHMPATAATDLAELEAVVASMRHRRALTSHRVGRHCRSARSLPSPAPGAAAPPAGCRPGGSSRPRWGRRGARSRRSDARRRRRRAPGRRASDAGPRPSARPDDVEGLAARQAQRRGALTGQELERQDAHAHEVGAMDALVRLGEDGADAQQARALGGPVARAAAAVLLAGEDDEGHALGRVAHRGVVDEHLVARRLVRRVRALLARPARCAGGCCRTCPAS